MNFDVRVSRKMIANLYWEHDGYVLNYLPSTDAVDFLSV